MLPSRSRVFNAVSAVGGAYEVYIYANILSSPLTIYEIYKPFTPLPFSFILDAETADVHIFHDLTGCDEFNDDNYFIGLLWLWLHNTPFRRGGLDISLEDEPQMYRRNADDLIYSLEQTKLSMLMVKTMDQFVGR